MHLRKKPNICLKTNTLYYKSQDTMSIILQMKTGFSDTKVIFKKVLYRFLTSILYKVYLIKDFA